MAVRTPGCTVHVPRSAYRGWDARGMNSNAKGTRRTRPQEPARARNRLCATSPPQLMAVRAQAILSPVPQPDEVVGEHRRLLSIHLD